MIYVCILFSRKFFVLLKVGIWHGGYVPCTYHTYSLCVCVCVCNEKKIGRLNMLGFQWLRLKEGRNEEEYRDWGRSKGDEFKRCRLAKGTMSYGESRDEPSYAVCWASRCCSLGIYVLFCYQAFTCNKLIVVCFSILYF